ncbi:MAG: ATPase [Methanobrevibacter wolinii]|uniref:ATPase n=1 Tax=Methanobrevibacter wolinii TaxID=190977 RepID=UPI0005B26D08|nr:ATPase [Methanobrevibacter wolinii]MDD5959521.1 ATPase [Methanobrevibacter wolinii]
MVNKEDLIKNIKRIRKEIGHEDMEINIKELNYCDKTNELWIITDDRPDKSAIIGKGGWVVGRLREDLGYDSIHVESYTDFIQKEYRLKLSYKKLNSILDNKDESYFAYTPLINLKNTMKYKLDNIYTFNLKNYLEENYKETFNDNTIEHKAVVALSGGVDSSFSLVFAKYLGFNPIAITIDPGTIVLPKQFKYNIDNLCRVLPADHEYIPIDYTNLIEESFTGRFHPCGRCSGTIEKRIFQYSIEHNIPLVIFGDMLSTGSQCITDNYYNNKLVQRLNLPASLSCGKLEGKHIMKDYPIKSIKGFGCPLLYEVHKKFPHMKKYSIQRILRETRAGALEVGEALDLIWSFYRTK